jgi:hypothetical protein
MPSRDFLRSVVSARQHQAASGGLSPEHVTELQPLTLYPARLRTVPSLMERELLHAERDRVDLNR